MTDTRTSVLSPCGYGNSSCGYCHSDDTSYTYGVWAHSLTCTDYQTFVDHGWRRSGKYLYKPDLSKSCCPQYTIRLDANGFQATKSQRKVINKFNRYIEGSWQPKHDGADENMKEKFVRSSKVNYDTSRSLAENIHKVEDKHDLNHALKIELEPSSFSDEKYQVYRKYQIEVHRDKPSKLSERSFRRFLVDSPLQPEPFPEGKHGSGYGSFHQKYVIDGKLVAVAVLDILPKCVSSVYFMYDPEYAFLGLGKYSALREISLVQEFSESISSDLHYYYMGFYIHDCQKMKYKGTYHPSDLLDAETYTWYPIDDCKKLLDKSKYVVFSDPKNETRRDPDRLLPGTINPKDVKMQDLGRLRIAFEDGNTLPVHLLWRAMPQETRDAIKDFIAVISPDMASRVLIQ